MTINSWNPTQKPEQNAENTRFEIRRETEEKNATNNFAEALFKENIINSLTGKTHRILVIDTQDETEFESIIGSVTGVVHTTDNHTGYVGEMGGVSVSPEYRGNLIGTTIKNGMLNTLRDEGVSVVYSLIVSDGGEAIARKTGFSQVSEELETALHEPLHNETDGDVLRKYL
jgi:N-acetylglutamate synthase-like GNAT family acetyltransferase